MDFQALRLRQVEAALKTATVPDRPIAGWLRTIRATLGMTTSQLARRLNIAQSSVSSLERSEIDDRITLQALRKAAAALDCELHYVLVPRTSLSAMIDTAADKLASALTEPVLHTMRLEAQAAPLQENIEFAKNAKNTILAKNWKALWK